MILAGDIGGTNTRLAYFDVEHESLGLVSAQTFPSQEFAGLEEILDEFRAADPQPVAAACFGVAGPVRHGRCVTSNLAWEVDARLLASQLTLETVHLVNDLEANACGIEGLAPEDCIVLSPGEVNTTGNAALISPGTGLGQAGLHRQRNRFHPFASEGGHADFAPRNEIEIALLRYLLSKFARVSYERVLSGPGLHNIYQFLRDTGHADEAPELRRELEDVDPAPIITTHGLSGEHAICVQALDIFVDVFGAEAGNLALKLMATGGLYIGGGIAPKIISKLQEPAFMAAFTDKGRLSPVLVATPVRVIMNDRTALYGAARLAASGASLL